MQCVSHEEGIEQNARQFIPKDTEHQNSGAVAFASVFELRATASTDARYTFDSKVQSCTKAKAYFDWIIVNSQTCPSTSRILHDTEVVMRLAEQYDGHMF